jgi:hypothetical protein
MPSAFSDWNGVKPKAREERAQKAQEERAQKAQARKEQEAQAWKERDEEQARKAWEEQEILRELFAILQQPDLFSHFQ